MDRLAYYREVIMKILRRYEKIMPMNLPEAENFVLCDESKNHYQLLRIGFEDLVRVYYCVFHFEIKNEKIWIHQDVTDIPVVQLLLDANISREEIVLAFHPMYRREMSGFATH